VKVTSTPDNAVKLRADVSAPVTPPSVPKVPDAPSVPKVGSVPVVAGAPGPGGITSAATTVSSGGGAASFSGGASVGSDSVSQATTAAKVASAPSLDGALDAANLGTSVPQTGPSAIDNLTGRVRDPVAGAPGGAPSVDSLASTVTPSAPDVSSYTSAATSPTGGRGAVGVATDAAGAGEVVARTESAQGTAETVKSTVADPGSAASSRATAAVSDAAPVDPSAVKADTDLAKGAVDNPEAAAANQVHFGVDTSTSASGASVQVEGSASAPTLDPTKKR